MSQADSGDIQVCLTLPSAGAGCAAVSHFRKPSRCTAGKAQNAALQSVLSDSKQSAGPIAMQTDLQNAYYSAGSQLSSSIDT